MYDLFPTYQQKKSQSFYLVLFILTNVLSNYLKAEFIFEGKANIYSMS